MPHMDDCEARYREGMAIRREVLGDAYVDRALATSGPLGEPLQRLVTEYCWGSVWARGTLDRKTRSLINIAMLAALNRPQELALHMGGALRNGCSAEEIQEVVLQIAVYAGVPAGIEAIRLLREAVDEADTRPQ
jgi:4-carboxymuconolactone decarboxylase